jgi:hypothetical protein
MDHVLVGDRGGDGFARVREVLEKQIVHGHDSLLPVEKFVDDALVGEGEISGRIFDRSRVAADSILVVFALRAAGVFVAAGTTRALRSGLIPRWFAFVSYAVVIVLLLTVARVRAVSLLFPAWVGVMSVIVLVKRPGSRPADSA